MGKVVETIKSAQEKVETITPSPEVIRTNATDTIHGCYDTIKGSGSLMTELGNVGHACIDMPANAVGGALKATGQLLTCQPVTATCTAGKALVDTCKAGAKVAVSPVPLTLAALRTSLAAAKRTLTTVVGFPRAAVLGGYRKIAGGVNRFLDEIYGSGGGGQSKAPDLGETAATPASAPAAI